MDLSILCGQIPYMLLRFHQPPKIAHGRLLWAHRALTECVMLWIRGSNNQMIVAFTDDQSLSAVLAQWGQAELAPGPLEPSTIEGRMVSVVLDDDMKLYAIGDANRQVMHSVPRSCGANGGGEQEQAAWN